MKRILTVEKVAETSIFMPQSGNRARQKEQRPRYTLYVPATLAKEIEATRLPGDLQTEPLSRLLRRLVVAIRERKAPKPPNRFDIPALETRTELYSFRPEMCGNRLIENWLRRWEREHGKRNKQAVLNYLFEWAVQLPSCPPIESAVEAAFWLPQDERFSVLTALLHLRLRCSDSHARQFLSELEQLDHIKLIHCHNLPRSMPSLVVGGRQVNVVLRHDSLKGAIQGAIGIPQAQR
jgi:hypothetical protein